MKAEVQIRTVALDFWADLEHQLQYKRQNGAGKPPAAALKQCAGRSDFSRSVGTVDTKPDYQRF